MDLKQTIEQWSFGRLLKALRAPSKEADWLAILPKSMKRRSQSQEDLARLSGITSRWLYEYENDNRPPDLETFESLLKGLKVLNLKAGDLDEDSSAWCALVREELKMKFERGEGPPRQPKRPKGDAGDADASPDDRFMVDFAQLDQLPVDQNLAFTQLCYGEGAHRRSIEAARLVLLSNDTKLLAGDGTFAGMTQFAPPTRELCEALGREKQLFFPRVFRVMGRKRDRNWVLRTFVCTDIPYGAGIDRAFGATFESECVLGLGGMAAFVDLQGQPRPRNNSEPFEGLGCAAAIVAVAFAGGQPQCRSRYVLAIRKGIRYPDDLLFSKDGKPFASSPHDMLRSRLFFQSWETKGNSKDIFVSDYNGARQYNLNSAEESAWDGFVDSEGNEVARWTDDGHIVYCSTVLGNGVSEVIVKPDPFWRRGKKDDYEAK